MTARFRKAALVSLRLVVVGGALAFVVRGVAWAQVGKTLQGASLPLLFAVVAVNACMMTLKAVRLQLLLTSTASLKACFLAKLTASAINNVVPFRGGDVARLWMLERHAGIPKSAAAAVGVVEALFELFALAAISLAGALVIPAQRWAVQVTPALLGASAALIAALTYISGRPMARPAMARPAMARPARAMAPFDLSGRLRALAGRLRGGTTGLREPGTVAVVLILSFCIWGLEISMVVLAARAIHLALSPALAAVVLLGINLAMALPSMPAGAGTFEGGALLVLMLSGVAKEAGLAFALLYHLVQVVPVTLLGIVVISKAGFRLDRLPIPRLEAQRSRPSRPAAEATRVPG
jgi:glycosyltransferase 2 family protein